MPARQRPKGHLWSDYASGEMPAGQRHALLQHLGRLDHGERGLLANARCLAEGVDVPTLDSVAFIDPRRSEVDIVQAVGRAIRLAPDKTVGTIVIPVFIDTDEDPEIALDDSAFKPVWDVIKALRSHDDELGEQLDELRRQLGRQGRRPRLPGKIHFDLPARVGIDFARAFDVRLVEQTTASWEFWFGLLEQFVERHGHARVPRPTQSMATGSARGSTSNATVTRQAPLTLTANADSRTYPAGHGTPTPTCGRRVSTVCCTMSSTTVMPASRAPTRSMATGSGRGSTYNADDYSDRHPRRRPPAPTSGPARLDLGPSSRQMGGSFRRLLDYVERHGDARVPTSYTVDGYKLGKFLNAVRVFHARGTLDADRESRLESCPAGRGTLTPTGGRTVSGGYFTTSKTTATRASLRPTQSMAIDSATGSPGNASTMPKAPLTPTANADLRAAWLDVGRPRRPLGGGVCPTRGIRETDWACPRSEQIHHRRLPTRRVGAHPKALCMPEAALRLVGNANSKICQAGRGTRRPRNGRRASVDCWITQSNTVTPGYRLPTASMVIRSEHGSAHNATATLKAPLMPTANAGSKTCPAGHGRHCRRPVGGRVQPTRAIRRMPPRCPRPEVLHSRGLEPRPMGSRSSGVSSPRACLMHDRQRRLQDLPGWSWDTVADAALTPSGAYSFGGTVPFL